MAYSVHPPDREAPCQHDNSAFGSHAGCASCVYTLRVGHFMGSHTEVARTLTNVCSGIDGVRWVVEDSSPMMQKVVEPGEKPPDAQSRMDVALYVTHKDGKVTLFATHTRRRRVCTKCLAL